MGRFLSSNKEEIGLSPYAIVFRGEKKNDKIRMRIIDFDASILVEKEILNIGEALSYKDSKTTTWFNIDGLHDETLMQEVLTGFDIDPIIIADVLNTHGRPKVHEFDNCIYMSVKMLQYVEEENMTFSENLVIIIKENLIISFQEKEGDIFEPIRIRLRKNKKKIRSGSSDYLAFAILDIVIDNYIYILSVLGESIEAIDDDLIINPTKQTLSSIYKYKGEINYMRKIVKPCREMIFSFLKLDSELLDDYNYVHFKELENNINHANESVENYSTMLSDQLSIFHTIMSDKLNEILKTLTIFSVIFIPITFIAGIYGTNFDYIPELHFRNGYFVMWIAIVLITVSMLFYFKKKKWF